MRILQHLSADFETIRGSHSNNLIGHINFFLFFLVSSPYIFLYILYTYIVTLCSIHTGLTKKCIGVMRIVQNLIMYPTIMTPIILTLQ
jgi:hypothetical protein